MLDSLFILTIPLTDSMNLVDTYVNKEKNAFLIDLR